MNMREAKGTQVDIIDVSIEAGFSNFNFVDTKFGNNANIVMRRILSLGRKLGFKTLLIDELREIDSHALLDENEETRRIDNSYIKSSVIKYSFFSNQLSDLLDNPDFLGYVIVKIDYFSRNEISYVYEAVLQPPLKEQQNCFIHSKTEYKAANSLGFFSICGVLYAQQSSTTAACAHSSIKSIASLFDKELTYAEINKILNIDYEHAPPAKGLSAEQIETVFANIGLTTTKIIHEPNITKSISSKKSSSRKKPRKATLDDRFIYDGFFEQDLYFAIESGQPSILGFAYPDHSNKTKNEELRHAIPVFGHIFNEDSWEPHSSSYFSPKNDFVRSANWASDFVIHDDNHGPYYFMPKHYLPTESFRILLSIARTNCVTGKFDASAIEAITASYIINVATKLDTQISNINLPDNYYWYKCFSAYAKSGLLVLRTTLITESEYTSHLLNLGYANKTIISMCGQLPSMCWITEFSASELFSRSRRKFGETITSVDGEPIFTRLPGFSIQQINKGQPDANVQILPNATHTALFKF